MATLADRVEREDERRFVGRAAEMTMLEQLLTGEEPQRVVLLHGPGGIGKSTLLRQLRRRALEIGWTVRMIDGRDGVPTSGELAELLSATGSERGLLVLLDSFERLTLLSGHLRNVVLPSLPANSLVVVAQRGEPDPEWMQGGWESVTLQLELAPVSEEVARELLRKEGILDEEPTRALVDWARGSPLALSVGADALRRSGSWGMNMFGDHPALAHLLLRRLTAGELDSGPLDVATVASIARRTDARLLTDVLPGLDGPAAADWLRSCTFAEALEGGLTLHELVRVSLRTEVRRERPERERELRRRIAEHFYARACAGEPGLFSDLAELVDSEPIRWGLGGEGISNLRTDDARPEDVLGLDDPGPSAGGPSAVSWLQSTRALVRDAPECALVVRDRDDLLSGLCISVAPLSAPAAAHRDPVLGPWIEHALTHHPDGNALLWRDSLDFTAMADEITSRVRAVMNAAALRRSGIASPRCSYLPIDPDVPTAVEFARAVQAVHVPELDVEFDDRRYDCYVLDHGEGGLLAAHRATIHAELGIAVPAAGGDNGLPINAETIKEALRNYDRPLELARSPLARGRGTERRAASVRELLARALEGAFGRDPEELELREVLGRRYLGEPTTHELVAEAMFMSRATYFRRLRAAMDRLAEYALSQRD
jgi:hypothetical protein